MLGSQLSTKFSSISQLSTKFLAISQLTVNFSKSQLIFFPEFYILVFLFKISQTHTSVNSIRRSAAFVAT